jgi:putative FmdB family regulatory protein
MPFYEYQCQSCQYYVEVMQKITDAPLRKCPSCGRMTLVKLISAPVFRLKGSGWYETDFKSDKEAKRNLAGAEPEESKPAEAAKSAAKTPAASPASPPAAAKPAAAPAAGGAARRRAKPTARAAGGRVRGKTSAAKRATRGRSKR